MMRFSLSLIAFAVCTAGASLNAGFAFAAPLSLEDVLSSSARHYPEIQIALAKLDEKQGGVREALGGFDASLESSYYDRVDGFYSGGIADTKIVKPFQDFGAKATIGYRRADGNFPVYENYFFTNQDGEANASLSLSLLRNRDIDPKRFKLRNSEIELDQTRLNLLGTKISVQSKAYKAYLEWLASGHKYRVYRLLLKTAEDRQDALRAKAERGDVSDISVTENRQFILQRKETVLDAKRQFDNAANRLSLFYRSDAGLRLVPDLSDMPDQFPGLKLATDDVLEDELDQLFSQRPDIQAFENQKRIAQNNVELGENNMLPAVDLELTSSDDFGTENSPRDDWESTVKLNLSVPLQKRLGEGRAAKGEAIKQQADFKKSLALDKLKISFHNTLNNIKAARGIYDLTSENISVTRTMETAERTMFDNGQSDFFLVNIREINTANAQINNIEAQKNLYAFYVDYFSLILDTDSLRIN